MRNVRAAVVFLTRVPVGLGGRAGAPAPTLTAAVPWFPVVGALVGAAVGGAAVGLGQLVPPAVAAAVAVLFGILLTGAFHEDGLADVADAFAGGWTPEQRLRILKDPLHGSYGVAALAGSIVVRILCVAVLAGATAGPSSSAVSTTAVAFACVVAAHTLGRVAAVGLMVAVPVARPDGLGAEYAAALRLGPALAGITAGIAIAAVAVGWWVAPFVAAAVVGAAVIARLATTKIGGVTGDVLGAAEQIVECLVLVVATGLATRYALWWS